MIPTLDRQGPIPLYQQIQDWMREQIALGHWPEHYQLKSEIDLATELDVNRGTVRNAIKALIAEGFLTRIHGKGTFVASRSLEQPLAESMITFSEGLIEQNISFRTTVIEQEVIKPDAQVASLLGEPSKIFYLQRVRSVGKKPVIFLKNHVVYDYCKGIETVDFKKNRLFEVLESNFELVIDWGRRTFEAQIANEEVAHALHLSGCAPVMYAQQLVYLKNGEPLELSDLWIRGDDFRVSALVKRGSRKSHISSKDFMK